MILRVRCSPEHARKLAHRMSVAGEFEVAAALQILADEVEEQSAALMSHHALHNLPERLQGSWGDPCSICVPVSPT